MCPSQQRTLQTGANDRQGNTDYNIKLLSDNFVFNAWNQLCKICNSIMVLGQLLEALRYKPEGSTLDSVIGIFHWYNPVGRTMALGSTQPLTEMSTRNISWGVKAAGP
jgi:hypothetical protein